MQEEQTNQGCLERSSSFIKDQQSVDTDSFAQRVRLDVEEVEDRHLCFVRG